MERQRFKAKSVCLQTCFTNLGPFPGTSVSDGWPRMKEIGTLHTTVMGAAGSQCKSRSKI